MNNEIIFDACKENCTTSMSWNTSSISEEWTTWKYVHVVWLNMKETLLSIYPWPILIKTHSWEYNINLST